MSKYIISMMVSKQTSSFSILSSMNHSESYNLQELGSRIPINNGYYGAVQGGQGLVLWIWFLLSHTSPEDSCSCI